MGFIPDQICFPSESVIIVILIILAVFIFARYNSSKDRFASQKAEMIHNKAKPVFDSKGANTTYTDYKMAVGKSNVVEFADVKNMWLNNKMTPENIDSVVSR